MIRKISAGWRWMLVLVAFVAASLGHTSRAEAANWYDGSPSRIQHICNNFISQTSEDLTWTWVGFRDVDDAGSTRLPRTGEVYYVRIVMAGLGCSGAYAYPELALPRGTSFAISGGAPIRCFYENTLRGGGPEAIAACPSQPSQGLTGAGYYGFAPSTQPYWTLPTGGMITIEIPVVSTLPLSGMATNDWLAGAVNVLDNNPGGGNPPWDLGARQGVFVTAAGAPRSPYVSYADDASVPSTTTATTDFTIHNYDCTTGGQLVGDLFPVVDQVDTAAFDAATCVAGCCSTPCQQNYVTYRYAWKQLTPDREYKWRGYLQNLSIAPGCARDLADAQLNAEAPQWAYFRTLPTSAPTVRYNLFLTGSAGGALAATPQDVSYPAGTVVSVGVSPEAGYEIASLLVDGQAAVLPLGLTMDRDHSVVAAFQPSGASSSSSSGGGAASSSGAAGSSSSGEAAEPGPADDDADESSAEDGGCRSAPGSMSSFATLLVGLLLLRRRAA